MMGRLQRLEGELFCTDVNLEQRMPRDRVSRRLSGLAFRIRRLCRAGIANAYRRSFSRQRRGPREDDTGPAVFAGPRSTRRPLSRVKSTDQTAIMKRYRTTACEQGTQPCTFIAAPGNGKRSKARRRRFTL
jgi:hypothetical protein